MSGWAEFGMFLGALALSAIVFCVIAYWPQRPPRDQTVEAIRKHIEGEDEE
ncbi:hypothetical protein ACQP0C_09750 [Nocardia sp. CA-129566]|uniref:hypothetical protein n=1 Tax=Nocardia sp. CA-129566 TaxID=3239976 RepID=UPI003D962F47